MNSLASPKLDFEALVHEHQGIVYNVALRVTRDRAAAEDVTQQVFLKLFEERGLPPGVASTKAYVARVATNAALNALRAGDRRARHEEKALPRSTPMSPIDALEHVELRAAVDDLPVELRLPVVLHYFQGLTYAEVAEGLDVPSGTVASRIHSAIGRLRGALAGVAVLAVAGSLEAALEGTSPESVPADLTERLLEIPSLPPVPTAPPSAAPAWAAALGGPMMTVVLLMVTVSVALIAAVRLTRSMPLHTASEAAPVAGPTTLSISTDAPVALTTSVVTPAGGGTTPIADVPNEELTLLEGFLVRRQDGTLEVARLYTDPVQTMASAPNLLTPEAARAFEGMDLGGRSFDMWLVEPKPLGPPARVWVRLRGTVQHERSKTDDSFDMGVDWFTTREIVAVDVLTEHWAEQWRGVRRSLARLNAMTQEPPSPGKRSEFVATAQEALHGIDELRRLREVEEVPAGVASQHRGDGWRRPIERASLWALRNLSQPFDLTPVGVPEFPTEESLREVFLSAKDQAGFRGAVLSRFGEDALDQTLCYYDGSPDTFSLKSVALDAAMKTWSAEEFLAVQGRAEKIGENHPKPEEAPAAENPAYAAHRARIASTGLEVVEMAASARKTALVTGGVEVRSVAQGSAADKAGLRVGDVIWRAHVPNNNPMGGQVGRIEAQSPSNPIHFGWLLGEAEAMEAITLDVLRDGGCVQVVLPRK